MQSLRNTAVAPTGSRAASDSKLSANRSTFSSVPSARMDLISLRHNNRLTLKSCVSTVYSPPECLEERNLGLVYQKQSWFCPVVLSFNKTSNVNREHGIVVGTRASA
eukprot:6170347-Amphidinium_carterae.1